MLASHVLEGNYMFLLFGCNNCIWSHSNCGTDPFQQQGMIEEFFAELERTFSSSWHLHDEKP